MPDRTVRRRHQGVIVLLAVALASVIFAGPADALSYPVCGPDPHGTVCQLPLCGTVPQGSACLLPLCGTGESLGDPCVRGEFLPDCSTVSATEPCRPDEMLECGLMPPGYPCWGTAVPEPPACTDALPVDTWCTAPDGNLCRVTSPGQLACLKIGGMIECQGPGQIVQDCIAGTGEEASPLLRAMTDAAVGSTLESHLLPAADAPLVMLYARNLVRGHLFADLLRIIKKDPRSPEEQEIVDYYAGRVRDLRVRQAEISEARYYEFAADPCGFVPPPGFTYTPSANCAGGLANLFANLSHPSLKDFKAYGISEIERLEVRADQEALAIAGGTRDAIIIGVGLAVAIGAAIGVYFLLAASALATTLAAVLTPYALVPFITGVVAGVGAVAASIAAAVFAIILLIVGTTVVAINYAEYDAFVADVTSLVEQADVTPNLRTAVDTERGMMDLFHVYVKSTQPDWPPEVPPPAPAATDPRFRVKDEAGNLIGLLASIDLSVDDGNGTGVLALSTSLHGGWFRPTARHLTPAGGEVEETSLSLVLGFIDWDGKAAMAARRGNQFVVSPRGADGGAVRPVAASEAAIVDEIRYLDATGARRSASVFAPGLVNGSFEADADDNGKPDGWLGNLNVSKGEGRVCDTAHDAACSARMRAGSLPRRLRQVVAQAGAAGDRLRLDFREKAKNVSGQGVYRAAVKFVHLDGTARTMTLDLPAGTREWTRRTLDVEARKDYASITVAFVFGKARGSVWLDDVSLSLTP